MHGFEIPRARWSAFFDELNRRHGGHLCTLAVDSPELARTTTLRPLLLAGIEPGTGAPLRVVLADWFGGSYAHAVTVPRRVLLERSEDGVDETLAIDGADGRTIMRFHASN